jgi:hypothetical protein
MRRYRVGLMKKASYRLGPPAKNTGGVQGTISTPFQGSMPLPVSDPSWQQGGGTSQYTSMNLNSTQVVTASASNTLPGNSKKIKTTGDLNLSGSNILTLAPYTGPLGAVDSYFEIWVPGQLVVSGSAQINQLPKVHVTFYVDNAINMSGGSVTNGNTGSNAASYAGAAAIVFGEAP